jgi:hypothetical protein
MSSRPAVEEGAAGFYRPKGIRILQRKVNHEGIRESNQARGGSPLVSPLLWPPPLLYENKILVALAITV